MHGKSGIRLILPVLCVLTAVFFLSAEPEALFQPLGSGKDAEPLNVKAGTVTSNVFFENTSLSGLTINEAIDEIEKPVETLKNMKFILQNPSSSEDNFESTASQLGISWNLPDIQETLLEAELSGNLMERYKKAKDFQASPVTISMNLSVDEEEAAALFEPLQEAWHTEPKSAAVSYKNGKLVVTPSVNGLTYDFTEGIHKMAEDVLSGNLGDTGSYIIDAAPVVKEPPLTAERASKFSIIGQYTTYYGKPEREVQFNRQTNVTVAANNMNGHTFAPGEQISALAMYGPVTAEYGYLPAGTINEGAHVDEIGGGICQVTTTLYNAGLLAELQIDFRRQHSQLVTYVPPSMDAMVYAAGHSDFKMTNNTSDYITLQSWVDPEECSINVIIIGHEDHPADHSVSFESEVLELTAPSMENIIDYSLPVGTDMEDRSVKYRSDLYNGGTPLVKSRSYKITRDGDQVKRELLNSGDTYQRTPSIFYVAPDTYVTMDSIWNPETQELDTTAHFFYLNGYPLHTDVNVMSWEERKAFNDSMEVEMQKRGMHWPGYEPPETEPSSSSETESTETKPSSTEPTETKPSSTEPTETKPSSTEPSSTEPPSTEPSSTEPPTTESSATEPPETEPPVDSTEPAPEQNEEG